MSSATFVVFCFSLATASSFDQKISFDQAVHSKELLVDMQEMEQIFDSLLYGDSTT
jgi:hypothetical protein